MPKPYPREFREDVVRVARGREPGQSVREIAADFGVSESCLAGWMKAADVGNEHAMGGLGSLAYDAGDIASAKSWYQKAGDLGNQHAIDELVELPRFGGHLIWAR